MNEKLILGMVKKYVRDGQLTYDDFEEIFDILSVKEQYAVINILHRNSIDLVDRIKPTSAKSTVGDFEDSSQASDDDFRKLYEESLYSDDEDESSQAETFASEESFLKVRKKIAMTNEMLVKLIQEGDLQAKQDLCIKNTRLIYATALKYYKTAGNKIELEDLVQTGMMGMLKAADKFDFSQGTLFSTYAVWWIRQAIVRYIYDNGFTIRIPVHKMDQIFKVCRLDAIYSYENNYNMRLFLISEASGYPEGTVEECLELYHLYLRSASLDVPVGEDEDLTLGEMIPSERVPLPEDTAIYNVLKQNIETVLETLTQREQEIIRLRFGLDDGRARTLEDVGKQFGVTRERIRQIEVKAIGKLRHPSRSRKLKGYLD